MQEHTCIWSQTQSKKTHTKKKLGLILQWCIMSSVISADQTFDIKLCKLQLLLMVPQQEVEVLPCYFLLVIKARRLHHGLDAVLRLALWQSAVGDFDERPASTSKPVRRRRRWSVWQKRSRRSRGGKRRGNSANLSILANSSLDKEPVPPMSFMVNISMDFSSGDPD